MEVLEEPLWTQTCNGVATNTLSCCSLNYCITKTTLDYRIPSLDVELLRNQHYTCIYCIPPIDIELLMNFCITYHSIITAYTCTI